MPAVHRVEILIAFEIVLDPTVLKVSLNFCRGLKVAERIEVVNERSSLFVGAPMSPAPTGIGAV